MARAYISNIRRFWPVSRQEAVLDEAVPGWRKSGVYRDIVPPRKRVAHGPGELQERADMLRPTRRKGEETVYVASLSVLAWTAQDFARVMSALADRNATLVSVTDGAHYPPTAQGVAAAVDAFSAISGREEGVGPMKGAKVSAERREARAKAACDTIKERWRLPNKEHPTKALCAEAGVSRATAIKHLGDRGKVQRAHANGLKAAERNRARRKSDV